MTRLTPRAAQRRRFFHMVVAVLVLVTAAGAILVMRAVRTQMSLVKLKSDFIANVSHEMKTPVSAVRMFAELLTDRRIGPEKRRELARVLRSESERLSGIVENVLDFARLERGELSLAFSDVALSSLLKRVSDAFVLRARIRNVEAIAMSSQNI